MLPEDRKADQDTIERGLRLLHHRGSETPTASRTATEKLILDQLTDGEASAVDIAERAGVSRATAQRHLAALAARGLVEVSLRYGTTGRPEHRYRART